MAACRPMSHLPGRLTDEPADVETGAVMYQHLEPLDPRDAFEVVPTVDNEATQSAAATQAALLLAARDGVLGISDEELHDLELEARSSPFTVPPLQPLERTRRLKVADATRPLHMSGAELRAEPADRVQEAMAAAVHRLYDQPDTLTAAALFEAGMQSPHPLVRVAAAAGARETTRLREEIRAILHAEMDSPDPTVAALARTAMGQIRRDDEQLRRHLRAPGPAVPRDRESSTAVLTHGTWGSDGAWYQPGGDFHAALDAHRPDLDVHDRSFQWSGSYTDAGRRQAARELRAWLAAEGLVDPDLLAHSHGGTVANLASRDGARFSRLVLLAWPVHAEWFPDPARVGRVIDIRVRLDLVIMLDRGGQRIRGAPFPVEEHRQGWFDHASVHEPAYWDEHGLWAVL